MHPLLSDRAQTATTSAIRDLLEHAQRPGMISLAGGLPDPSLFPVDALADIAEKVLRDDGARTLQYGLTAGSAQLRRHIAETTLCAAEILITTGSQQALHLIGQVVLDPGDTVVVGDPDYLGALQAFRSRGASLTPIPIDREGLCVDVLAERLHAGLRPKLVYTVPHFHNPTGSTLSPTRRERLLELADQFRFLLVFDDPYRELSVGPSPQDRPDAGDHVVELRSVSKILAPGLRVGWMLGPAWLTDAVERAKQAADLHTSTLTQALVFEALRAPWFAAHLHELKSSTAIKRRALCDALGEHFGSELDFHRPSGGMFVWARFTDGRDTGELLEAALDRGVAFVPGAAFAVERPLHDHLRLSWATTPPELLRTGVERLRG